MTYQIVRTKDGHQTTEHWQGKFTPAKERAWRLIESGEADHVSIYDDIGRLKFHRPRMVRRR